MRVLILGINFYPEPTSTGKYSGELAAYLCRNGFEVRVITAPPYYPHWRVAEGYRSWCWTRESWQGVEIWRCPLWVPRRPIGMKRLLHLASFALSCLPALAAQLRWRPQVVLCVAPTLMAAPGGLLLARLCSAKSWLHLQDFELDAALSLGLLPGKRWLARLGRWFERAVLGRFDRVSTISERMLTRLPEKGVAADKLFLLPNWVDTDQIIPLEGANPLRVSLGLKEGTFTALYAGSMGNKQGLETVVEAARLLKYQPNILFILCGDGTAQSDLEHSARELSNLRFLPVQPANRFNQLLNLADIHLLPQKEGAADLVMPSKLSGMLASGKVVIAAAHADSGIGEVVGQTGVLVPPEDAGALAEAILRLARSPAERARLGKVGRAYALAHWDAEKVLNNFCSGLRNNKYTRKKILY